MVQKETKKTKEQNRFFKVCYLGSVKDEKEFEIINKNFSILEQTIKIKYFIPQKFTFKSEIDGTIFSEYYCLYLLLPKNIDNDTINEATKPYGFELRSAKVQKVTITDITKC